MLNDEILFAAKSKDQMHLIKRAKLTTLDLRVKFINNLRVIVSRRIEKPSDLDIVNAEAHEEAEALIKALTTHGA